MKLELLPYIFTAIGAAAGLGQAAQAPVGQRPATGETGRPVAKPADRPTERPAERPAPAPAPGKEAPPAAAFDLAKVRGLFAAADVNKDGKVEPREAAQAGVDERNFKLFDHDHDGAVSIEEFVFGYRSLLREANQPAAPDLDDEVRRIAELRKAKQAKEERRENGADAQGERKPQGPGSRAGERGGVDRPAGGQGGADRPAPKPEPKPAPRPKPHSKPKPKPPRG
jgi:hypothetical protein